MKACPESPARRPPRQRAAAPHTSCPQLPGPPPKPFGPHHCPAFHHVMWAALLNHTSRQVSHSQDGLRPPGASPPCLSCGCSCHEGTGRQDTLTGNVTVPAGCGHDAPHCGSPSPRLGTHRVGGECATVGSFTLRQRQLSGAGVQFQHLGNVDRLLNFVKPPVFKCQLPDLQNQDLREPQEACLLRKERGGGRELHTPLALEEPSSHLPQLPPTFLSQGSSALLLV